MLPRNTPDLPTLFGELVRLEIELWEAVDSRLRADAGLTVARFQTLQAIAGRPGCRVQDVADDLVITVGGASKIVDRVVAAGHCTRSPNPADKRSSLLTLTPPGEQALRTATTLLEHELHRRIGAALPPGALEAFTTTLTTLRAATAAAATPSGSPVPTAPAALPALPVPPAELAGPRAELASPAEFAAPPDRVALPASAVPPAELGVPARESEGAALLAPSKPGAHVLPSAPTAEVPS
jgi:DNA-binding MarR family transcriptional regulator